MTKFTFKKPSLYLRFITPMLLLGCSSTEGVKYTPDNSMSTVIQQQIDENQKISADTSFSNPTPITVPDIKHFSLNVKDAPLETILNTIFEKSEYTVVFPEEIKSRITLKLKNTTAYDFLEIIKKLYNYDYEVFGNQIIIYNNTVRTRVYTINHLIGHRQGSSELKITSGSLSSQSQGQSNSNGSQNGSSQNNQGNGQSGQSESSKLITTTDSNFWVELKSVIETMISKNDKTSIVVSPQTNTLVVKALPSELKEVESYLSKIHANIQRQVMIEAKILEVELSNGQKTGINWAAFSNNKNISTGFAQPNSNLSVPNQLTVGSNSSFPGETLITGANNPMLGMFTFALQNNNFAAILNFIQTQGQYQVLSSPRIATLNNQKAILKVGTDEFFVTNISTTSTASAGGTTSSPTLSTQAFFSGISLDITPQIDSSGMVTMHVKPSISQVSTVTKSVDLGTMGNYSLPLASSSISETDSVVKIPNNTIVAIGGLMKSYSKKNNARLPYVADTPIIGNAFQNREDDIRKYELVILLKPLVIESLADWQKDLINVKQQLSQVTPVNQLVELLNSNKPQ